MAESIFYIANVATFADLATFDLYDLACHNGFPFTQAFQQFEDFNSKFQFGGDGRLLYFTGESWTITDTDGNVARTDDFQEESDYPPDKVSWVYDPATGNNVRYNHVRITSNKRSQCK